MDVHAYLAEAATRVEREIDALLPPAEAPPARLHAAMRHLLFPSGGKRLRPALTLAACEAAGRPGSHALRQAAAVELVHTYSLVHDDLPCMDDDAERRGRPAVHVRYGEALAVLAGDALLARAFAALAEGPALTPDDVRFAIRELAHAAGSEQLVGGQAADLELEGGDTESVEAIHRRKTAALFRCAVVLGGRAGGAEGLRLAQLARFGEAFGVAFQIADDCLDAGEPERCSWLRFGTAEAAATRCEALLAEALAELEGFAERAEPLRELARHAVRRER